MKKGILLIILLLFLLPLVLSQSTGSPTDPTSPDPAAISSAADNSAVASTRDLRDKSNTILGTEREIPSKLVPLVKLFFRYGETITVSQAIISLMILVFLAVLFIEVMAFGPFSENTQKIIGVILALLAGMIGVIKSLTNLLLNIGGQFTFIENWSAGSLTFAAIILVALAVLLLKVSRMIKRTKGINQAFERGAKVGADLAYTEAQREVMSRSTHGGGI